MEKFFILRKTEKNSAEKLKNKPKLVFKIHSCSKILLHTQKQWYSIKYPISMIHVGRKCVKIKPDYHYSIRSNQSMPGM